LATTQKSSSWAAFLLTLNIK